MQINEIIFSKLDEPTPETTQKLLNGAEYVTELAGYELYKNEFPEHNMEVLFYHSERTVVGYTKLVQREHSIGSSFWWLMELWVKDDPEYRRKGLGSALVRYAKNQKKLLIIDNKLSANAYDMIRKMIANGNVQARVVDLKNGDAEDYDSSMDLGIIENQNKTFILEDYEPRRGMLQPMTLLNYIRLAPVNKFEE